MTFAWKYIALRVPDLRAAETFYCQSFSMDLLFRETEHENAWLTVDAGLDWTDVRTRGIDVAMVALRREAFVLALFRGTPKPGTVFELCVGVAPSEIEAIEARLEETASVLESESGFLRFLDPLGRSTGRRIVQEQRRDRRTLGLLRASFRQPQISAATLV